MPERRLFLATPLSPALAAQARTLVEHLRSDAPRRDRAEAAHAFIFAAAQESLRYHFRDPLDGLGVGAITRKGLEIALDLALKSIRGPMRSILNGFDDAQLARVADDVEARLYPDPHG